MGATPKQFALGKLTVEGDARLVSSKGMETFKFETKQKDKTEFEVHVTKPLEPGEYAFFMNNGGAPTQIWAFSLRTK